jgi:hypothetical protein
VNNHEQSEAATLDGAGRLQTVCSLAALQLPPRSPKRIRTAQMQKRTVHFETLGTILQEPYMAVTEWGALLALLALLWYRGGRDLDGVDKTKEVTRWD